MDITFLVNGAETVVTKDEAASIRQRSCEKGERMLALINSEIIRKFARSMWEAAPDYFFVIPASSSGKYHWATEIGGLFDHVLMGMYCASELARTFGLNDYEKDCTIAAIAGHDCLKYGVDYDVRYFDMHSFLPRSYYRDLRHSVNAETWELIMCAIERHMGSMNGEWTSVGRVKPETPVEQVVHLADYMSSRREIRMEALEYDAKL